MTTQLPVLLTFDDGPSGKRTEYVLETLASHYASVIVATFFVQTHSKDKNGTCFRMNNSRGDALVKRESKEQHVIAIHSGAESDHCSHPIRVTKAPTAGLNGRNGLETDLARAKEYIAKVIGHSPRYVRAPYFDLGKGNVRTSVLNAYANNQLKHVGANVQPKDGEDSSKVLSAKRAAKLSEADKAKVVKETISQNLRLRIREALQRGDNHLVVLFHDPTGETYKYRLLGAYIDVVRDAVAQFPPSGSMVAKFASSRAEAEAILAISKVEY